MLDRKILGLIELCPDGITNGQLLWRLSAGGTRYDATELLAALANLVRNGEIRCEGKRWRLARLRPPRPDERIQAPNMPGVKAGNGGNILRAAPAALGPGAVEETSPWLSETAEPEDTASLPDPVALLTYYAATQRRDPRGSVEAFPDGHGVKWHLFDCRGLWWEKATVSILTTLLSPAFLQALAESGKTGTAAVGWPVSVFSDAGVTVCLPGLLLPASWQLEDDRLTFSIDAVQPAINPTWIRQAKRVTGLNEDALLRAMESGEEETSLEVVARRFAHLLAKIGGQALRPSELVSEISLSGHGVRNAAAIFLPDESSFTRRVAEDIETIARWPHSRREGTALDALLAPGSDVPLDGKSRAQVVEVAPLTERQFIAADAALTGVLTLIQGPPGTGKSQTIVALISSALAAGQSVLFAARNHRALDEVEKRLAEILPGSSAVVRARDAEGERDTSLLDALFELANGMAADPEDLHAAQDRRLILAEAARTAAESRRQVAEHIRIRLALADLVERDEDLISAYAAAGARQTAHRGLLAWLRNLFRRSLGDPLSALSTDARPEEVRRHIAGLRDRLNRLPKLTDVTPADIQRHLPALVRTAALPDVGSLQHLRNRKSEIDFARGGPKMKNITSEDATIVLRHRPVWMATTLSVPARIPLAPGLFDLAIFDEASQCDIASALPILARAKQAVIVGDPEQLSFIPSLGNAQEHALMDAARLPKSGRGTWAQSRNSLFDFARNRIGVERLHLLPDQFRSAPAIVEYTSTAFYGGRLRARRSEDEFSSPHRYRPGLHWEDVCGPCSREDGGNINRTEAEAIAGRIAELAAEQDFKGSVGVISPFNAQVGLIRRLAEKAVSRDAREQMKLNVDTVDGWQGGEADVIFFSLAVGPSAAQSAVSFLSKERRRFNVAVSRARAVAVIVGDLSWAQDCGIAHVGMLADRATRPPSRPTAGFDSKWERRMNEALLRRGLDPKPQYPVGSRRLDFALFQGEVKLDLEVDGRKWHTGAGGERKVSDRLRDNELIAKKWKVRRFWVDELAADMEACLDIVEHDLRPRS